MAGAAHRPNIVLELLLCQASMREEQLFPFCSSLPYPTQCCYCYGSLLHRDLALEIFRFRFRILIITVVDVVRLRLNEIEQYLYESNVIDLSSIWFELYCHN